RRGGGGRRLAGSRRSGGKRGTGPSVIPAPPGPPVARNLPIVHVERWRTGMSRADGRHVWMKRVSVRLGESSFDLVPLIAHDLRTPITAIKGLSQLALRRPDLPDSTANYLSAVVEEANQIAALVDDLVLVRRLERGEVPAIRSKVDLNSLLRGILASQPTSE